MRDLLDGYGLPWEIVTRIRRIDVAIDTGLDWQDLPGFGCEEYSKSASVSFCLGISITDKNAFTHQFSTKPCTPDATFPRGNDDLLIFFLHEE